MKDLVERFVSIERAASAERGGFWLFALFLREDAQDKWDLLVSAEWTHNDPGGALRYLASLVGKEFEPEQLVSLSRIVLIDKSNPALAAINQTMRVEHSVAEVRDSMFFGLAIRHAFIITSRSPSIGTAVAAN